MTVLDEPRKDIEPARMHEEAPADWQPYRAISRSAIISLVLGLLGGSLGLLFQTMLALCVVGLVAGYLGRRNILKHPLEYTGLGIAKLGMAISAIGLLVGVSAHTYVFLTEIPDPTMTRVYFWELRPDDPEAREIEFPERITKLQGQKIFIKGYIHPAVEGMGKVKSFVLVGDMGTCCFGGQPNMFDMVEVKLDTEQGISYSTRLRKFGGKFAIQQPRQVNDLANVLYKLDANYVK